MTKDLEELIDEMIDAGYDYHHAMRLLREQENTNNDTQTSHE